MILKHNNESPIIAKDAYIAPNAVICGKVKIGKNTRIMFGAQIIAENDSIEIGENCIVLENAVIRSTEGHPVKISNNCLIGPNAHIAGCTVEDNVFIATGASVFHQAILKKGAEVRINAVVHLKTEVPENEVVPINWIAVGKPMQLFPPEKHNEIWEVQKPLDFPKTVYGIDRSTPDIMLEICKKMSDRLKEHQNDEEL